MMKLIVLAVILAASVGDLLGADRKADSPSFFGLNGVGFFHYRDAPGAIDKANQKLAWMQQAGAKWDRFDFWWGGIEPKKSRGEGEEADWLIDFYTQHGVSMLPILCYKAEWMKGPPQNDQDFTDYAR